ncbi:oxidoreductase [Photobacterium angustum]|uniref:NADH-quinone oxidoreductase subunit L n=1 Tax=Photobacterium angustum TaxID=661 RepID=UPI0005DAD245|nr:NADH-quinone oxidoreductase subunit L [Photobacterium angustum]KJG07232.1 oxidoreductase [Photobacterium angustum]PSV87694.1 NADH-quinone oxidoreductase subunit L [Photobacterium angustum]
MNTWLWLIPAAPLFSAALIVLFGKHFPTRASGILASLSVLVSAVLTGMLWLSSDFNPAFHQQLWTWMAVGDWNVNIGLSVDRLSLVMMTVTSWVGFLIHLFSVPFMRRDFGERRYFCYLNLFVAGMLFFVMADNLILLYTGWEIMGLCSYGLISHYYNKEKNVYSGRKAFVVTRIGDTLLAIGILLTFSVFKTVNLNEIYTIASQQSMNLWLIGAICLLFLFGGMAKSAQFPFHVWLPESMAGPSTVSALIHAATMVTAGVYLIARNHVLFNLVPDVTWWVSLVGAFTAFYAATCALAQNDIKRILAYSTISQIGYMFAALGVGAYDLAIFHVIVHACFKALLFISSGVIIDMFNHDHDIRKMGGLGKRLPWLKWTYLAGSASLAALPVITASFFSKDAIIAATETGHLGWLLGALGLAGALFTSIYSFRMYFMVFNGENRTAFSEPRYLKNNGLPWQMKVSTGILAVGSIAIGWMQFPNEWSFGPHLFLPWIDSQLGTAPEIATSAGLMLQVVGSLVAIAGVWIAYILVKQELKQEHGIGNCQFLNSAWYIDDLSKLTVIRGFKGLSKLLETVIERWVLNQAIVKGIAAMLSHSGEAVSDVQGSQLSRYVIMMIAGSVLLLFYLV